MIFLPYHGFYYFNWDVYFFIQASNAMFLGNAGYNGIPCGATYGAGTYQWINTCGYRACLGRGYTGGMVQEYACLDSTCGAVLTCF